MRTRTRKLVGVALVLASAGAFPTPAWHDGESEAAATVEVYQPSPFHRPLVLQAHRLRGLRGEIANLILTAEDGGELALAALAAPFQATTTKTAVPLVVEIDGASFLRHNLAPVARLEIYAYAWGSGGRVKGHLAEMIAVDVRGIGETVWQSGLKYFGVLELAPGSYTVRVLVRDFQSGAKGLTTVLLTVPGLGPQEGSAFVPIFPDPTQRDCWLPIRPARVGGEAETAYPFVADGEALAPAARPVLVAGRETQALLFGQPLPTGPLRGSLQLFDKESDDARVVAETEVRPLARSTTAAGLDSLAVSFTPPDLAPGEYLFRVQLADAKGEISWSPVGSFWLLAESTRERELIWSDLRWLLPASGASIPPGPTSAATPEPAGPRKRGRSGRRVRALSRDYRKAVSELVSQPPESVRSALLELESSALGRGGQSLRLLRDAELNVARELSEANIEALLPLVVLHETLYRAYRGRRLYSLVQHSRSQVEQLAELYVAQGGPAAVAADMLASVGGYVQEVDLPAESRRLFLRALEHDPGNAAALFGMATSHEKYAEYHQAVEYLDQLSRQRPDSEQVSLRWALNLDRTGRRRRFEGLLEGVTERCPGSWSCSLAFQELARSWLQSGAEGRAAGLLERGIERMPDRAGLRFLLAHTYDRMGRPNSAMKIISAVRPADARSERLRYDSWSNPFLEEARTELARTAEGTREALGTALAESATEEGG